MGHQIQTSIQVFNEQSFQRLWFLLTRVKYENRPLVSEPIPNTSIGIGTVIENGPDILNTICAHLVVFP